LALKFYADEKNYQWGECGPEPPPVVSDNGKIARDALEEKQ
jgi:hypothetical protein